MEVVYDCPKLGKNLLVIDKDLQKHTLGSTMIYDKYAFLAFTCLKSWTKRQPRDGSMLS
jgi:hypothetical protein